MVLLIRVLVIALRTLTLSIREPGQFYRQFCCHHPFTRFVHSSLLRQIREQIYRESFIRNVKILKYTNPDFPAFLRSIMQIKIRKRSTIIQTYSFIPGFDLISLDYPFRSSLIQKKFSSRWKFARSSYIRYTLWYHKKKIVSSMPENIHAISFYN